MAGETEFEDLLIQHGIIADPQKPEAKEEQHVYSITDNSTSTIESGTENEEEDEDDYFESYRQRRLAELKESSSNQVHEISRPDFVKEVTEASHHRPVVVHLYQDSVEESAVLKRDMRQLSGQFGQIKFVEIVASRCIPDYPDALVPTILYYYKGSMVQKITKAKPDGLIAFLNTIMESIQ
jgi:hypothetical protein